VPTIRDVARLARVSVPTVSGVLNGTRNVSQKTSLRVRAAMAALDYHPDQVARSLRSRRTQTIGFVIPDVTNPFFTDVLRGVEDAARQNGYSVILCNSNEDPAVERKRLAMLYSRRVDGVLIAPTDFRSVTERPLRKDFPLVYIDRVPPGFSGAAVVTDNLGAAYEATQYLISLGHRRLAIITGRLNISSGRDRLEGFRRALQEANLPLPEEHLRQGDFGLESGYLQTLELMRLKNPPTAIFSCNNKMTLGLMRALGELKIACPEQVSVFGFDDFEWAANFSPRLSTVAQPTYELGRLAMEMLIRKMRKPGSPAKDGIPETDKEDSEQQVITLKNELKPRDSTARVAAW
jgi:LacI family transcriptional regulator